MSEHYSTPKPTSEKRYAEYVFEVDGEPIVIRTVSGVFGKDRLDHGSRLLISSLRLAEGSKVLDLGCGTGVVGIGLSSRSAIDITFSDVNERAVEIARLNAKRNGVRASFVVSDGFARIDGSFDAILLNPPQSAGKAVCERLIAGSYDHLVQGGSLYVVARHRKGGKSLEAFMESVFTSVETVSKGSGFRVYRGIR